MDVVVGAIVVAMVVGAKVVALVVGAIVATIVGAIVVAAVVAATVAAMVGVAVAVSLAGKPKKLSHVAQQAQSTSSQSTEAIVKLLIAQTSSGMRPEKSLPCKLISRRLTRFPIPGDIGPEKRLNSKSKASNPWIAQSSSGSWPVRLFVWISMRLRPCSVPISDGTDPINLLNPRESISDRFATNPWVNKL